MADDSGKNGLSDSCKKISWPDHEEGFYAGAITSGLTTFCRKIRWKSSL